MRGILVAAAVVALLVVASTAAAAKSARYSAEIRRTAGGVPHIKARDYVPYTGSSFVLAAELTPKGPRGHAILRYSQSENQRSKHSAGQTRLYAQQKWLPLRFTDRQIKGDAGYAHKRVTGRR